MALPGPARPPELHAGVESERDPEPGRPAGVHRRPAARPGAAGGRLVHAAAGRWEEVQQRIEKLPRDTGQP